MKQKFLKLGMLAFTALMLTYCQREELGEEQPEEPIAAVDPQTAVSLEEAKSLFEASEAQKQSANSTSRSSRPLIELDADWRYFVQTKTRVGSAYSKIPITIADSDLNAEMLFLKENGVVTQYLFITEVDSLTNDNRIVNADFYLFTPKGNFISAHRMTDGVISHKLVPRIKGTYRLVVTPKTSQTARIWPWKKKKKNKAGSNKPQKTANHIEKDDSGDNNDDLEDDEFDYDVDAIQLEEVVVYGSGSGHYNPYPTFGNFGYNYGGSGSIDGYRDSGGGNVGIDLLEKNKEEEDRPDKPIKDLDCFFKGLDLSQGAKITIYIDEPKPDSGRPFIGLNVGHSFIGILQNGNHYVYGFYPAVPGIETLYKKKVSSVLGNDGNHKYTVSISNTISAEQLNEIIEISKKATDVDYSLSNFNCTDFAEKVAAISGIPLPDSYSSWGIGRGSNPGALGKDLKGDSRFENKIKTEESYAPISKNDCL